MATDLSDKPTPETLDLTGLPEPVIQGIRQIVDALREKPGGEDSPPPASKRWPLKGRFADLNLSIPKEHIDEAQREAWAAFPREFPEPPKSS